MKLDVRWWAAILPALALGQPMGLARAEGGETSRMAAETLFVEAKRLMEAGKYTDACPKFADSQRLDPGVGTLLNLALCYERQGRLASSWSTYREAASAARSAGQAEREGLARQKAAALEPRLSRLTVRVSSSIASAEGLEVRLDGTILPSGLWGVSAPVDPGEHNVAVSAKGRKPWSTRVQVSLPNSPVVTVPDLEPAPIDTSVSASLAATDPQATKNSQRAVALGLGGLGVVGVVVGSVFGLAAKSKYHEVDGECTDTNVCTQIGVDARNSAYGKATVATIAFSVGGAALAAGAILWFTAPKSDADAPRVGLSIVPGSIAIEGGW